MIGSFLLAGIGGIALGAVMTTTRRTFTAGLASQAIGASCCAVVGCWILATGEPVGSAFCDALRPRLGVDSLSGVFLATMSIVAAPVLLSSSRYLRRDRTGRAIGALTGLFLLIMTLALSARDAVTFLAGWSTRVYSSVGRCPTRRNCRHGSCYRCSAATSPHARPEPSWPEYTSG